MQACQPELPTFGLCYDYRNPTQWKTPAGERYRRSIDQAVWAEQLGFGSVWLSEHHFGDDYASSPLMMAAVLAGQTSTMRIGTNIVPGQRERAVPDPSTSPCQVCDRTQAVTWA